MKRHSWFALASLCLGTLAAHFSSCRADVLYSYYGGNVYTSVLAPGQVPRAPQWSPSDDNPPLSARKAARIATALLYKLLPDAPAWTLHEITLQPVFNQGKWVYVVFFWNQSPHRADDPDHSSSIPTMKFYVLLSGKAIEPSVTKQKRGVPGE